MKQEIIEYATEEEWLQLRTKDVTSTEVSCLFNCSPYSTTFELWHRKKKGAHVDIDVSERMKWGSRMEATIAHGIAEDKGWLVEPFKKYGRLPQHRMGSSFDFYVRKEPNQKGGVLEIKNVDGMIYKKNWLEDEEGSVEAPPHIELQLQHQMLVSGAEWGVIGALVGGNRVVLIEREADVEMHKKMLEACDLFWRSIKDDKPPEINFERDAEFLAMLYPDAEEGSIVEATEDLKQLALRDKNLALQEKDLEITVPEARPGTWYRVLVGDVLERLKGIPDGSVQCVVTSPPSNPNLVERLTLEVKALHLLPQCLWPWRRALMTPAPSNSNLLATFFHNPQLKKILCLGGFDPQIRAKRLDGLVSDQVCGLPSIKGAALPGGGSFKITRAAEGLLQQVGHHRGHLLKADPLRVNWLFGIPNHPHRICGTTNTHGSIRIDSTGQVG